ncbi:glycosyltransferase [Mycobacterium sp. ENV421]|uniref:WecB/TagA/CpsF family glycosyltransferase n=1 Tax=Mycobacterium sp. ENV421 TaxID=1213407 RepID=UPI000C9B7A03|nr:WecB/TagA/CpsF family glycosyltransferase [Mycobacterium sp. ENV421]PND57581.1 glycosyltransferase [Mycobacterium sp. ENV421]
MVDERATSGIGDADRVSIFGNTVANLTESEALEWLERGVQPHKSRKMYIVNAHTLNTAASDPAYAAVLRRADLVVGDGTGVRLAARVRGVRMKANLVGTDLMPNFFAATAGRGYRCFLLGADADSIERAADYFRRNFPGWILAGYHHGYMTAENIDSVIAAINEAAPELLLVGMGNPLQETWIDTHAAAIDVGVSVGVGGLFDHWGGNLKRAAPWVRRIGFEWVQLLLQQPHKARRYLVGNGVFLWRTARTRSSDLRLTSAAGGGRGSSD